MQIEEALPEDRAWIETIYQADRHFLGSVFGSVWYRFWQADNPREHWWVIRPYAFAHWMERLDGWKTLYEIAVDVEFRKTGYGRQLVAHIGTPLRLSTDAENLVSNLVYQKLGFTQTGWKPSRDGKRILIVYEKVA